MWDMMETHLAIRESRNASRIKHAMQQPMNPNY